MSTTKKTGKEVPGEKKETFVPPKAVDVEGHEIAEDQLEDKGLGKVSGGSVEDTVPGHLCLGGG